MKKSVVHAALVIAACLTVTTLSAQTTNKEEPKKVKVVIKENKNGNETVTEANELTPEVKQKLKEKGIDIEELEKGAKTGDGKVIMIKNEIEVDDNGKKDEKHVKVIVNSNDGKMSDKEMKEMMDKAMKESNVKVINENGVTKVYVNGKEVSSEKDGNGNKEVKVFVFKYANISDASSSDCKKAGIKETSEKDKLVVNDLTCSPNPSNGKFNLKFRSDDKTTPEVVVRDINGKVVYTEKATTFDGNFDKEISLDGAAKGIYLVTITQGSKAVTKKLVVE